MSVYMIFAVTVLYAISAGQQIYWEHYSLAIFLSGCSIANVGVMMMARG